MDAPVLDACCGSRMFWFDREDERAVFGDIRRERHTLTDASSRGGSRELIIDPDREMDFRDIPYPGCCEGAGARPEIGDLFGPDPSWQPAKPLDFVSPDHLPEQR